MIQNASSPLPHTSTIPWLGCEDSRGLPFLLKSVGSVPCSGLLLGHVLCPGEDEVTKLLDHKVIENPCG